MPTHTMAFVARARALWDQKPTVPTKAMAELLGISKNAVIGIAHRHHFTPRPSPIKPRGEERQPMARPKPSRFEPLPPRVNTLPPLPSEVAAAKPPGVAAKPVPGSKCCFPTWPDGARAPKPPVFCDAPCPVGSSYCEAHARRCWQTRAQAMQVTA